MAKRILAVLGLIMPLFVSYIIVATLESLDTVYPIGTTTFVSVDFSKSKAQKTDIVAALDALPYRKGEFGALSKTKMTSAADSSSDSAVSELFVFGDESQAERDLANYQYGGFRSVTLSPLSDLADASISGAYSFSDTDIRNSFEKLGKPMMAPSSTTDVEFRMPMYSGCCPITSRARSALPCFAWRYVRRVGHGRATGRGSIRCLS